QSPLASHHSPARACVSPAGGSVAVSDWRKSCRVILSSVSRNAGLPTLVSLSQEHYRIFRTIRSAHRLRRPPASVFIRTVPHRREAFRNRDMLGGRGRALGSPCKQPVLHRSSISLF